MNKNVQYINFNHDDGINCIENLTKEFYQMGSITLKIIPFLASLKSSETLCKNI